MAAALFNRTGSFTTMKALPFAVHSSFRDLRGRPLLPDGLEWNLLGSSDMAYVALEGNPVVTDCAEVRQGILRAQNRWCFAKDIPFKRLEDIKGLKISGPHVHVEWLDTRHIEHKVKSKDMSKLIEEHGAATGARPPAEVWINGDLVQEMLSPETVQSVLDAVSNVQSQKVCYKQSEDGRIIRIDRFFYGGLYHREAVFDHIMDNLIALEDPQILDNHTLIGTATLPDWIMGGQLTSRLFVQELENGNILFLRPLYHDDIKTSDRNFELKAGKDDDKICLVQKELERLRFLAALPSPHQQVDEDSPDAVLSSDVSVESTRSRQHRRNRRKFFRF